MRRRLTGGLAALLLAMTLHGTVAAPAATQTDWTAYLGGPQHTSFTSNDQITKSSAANLAQTWTWTPDAGTMSGQPAGGIYSSPTVYNHRIYIGANTGDFYALNEDTGQVIWKRFLGFQPQITCPAMGFVATAAVVPISSGGTTIPAVYVAAADGYLYAMNGDTGAVLWRSVIGLPSTTTNDWFNWSSPTILGGRIFIGFSSNCDNPFIRGGVKSFDQSTGAPIATWYGVPPGYIGAGVWSSVAATATGVYASTASGPGNTPGDAYSLVKLDPATLNVLGRWLVPLADRTAGDADFGSSTIVFNATVNGNATELMGACNKDGFFYTMKTSDFTNPLWRFKVGSAEEDGGSACLSGGVFDGSRLFLAGNQTTISGTSYQGNVRQVDPATGAVIWERGLPANVLGAASLNGAGVLAAATHDYIPSGLPQATYLLDADTGAVLNTISSNQEEFAQPVFADQYLLRTTVNSMYAYTASSSSDTSPPTAPTNLRAVATDGTHVNLTWTASTDNVGVTVYRVLRGGAAIATTTTNAFTDATAQPSTAYSYQVQALDAAGNTSPLSNTASLTTPGPSTTVTINVAEDAYLSQSSASSNFGSSTEVHTDNSPVEQFLLKFNVSGVGTRRVLNAKLRLYCVNPSVSGGDVRTTASAWDEKTVTWASGPTAGTTSVAKFGSVALNTWYEVDVTPTVTGDGTVSFRVVSASTDGARYSSKEAPGGVGPRLVLTLDTAATPDTSPPTAPTNLAASQGIASSVHLGWGAANDNVGVTDYRLTRTGGAGPLTLDAGTATTYDDVGVTVGTTYTYTVTAYDAAGNPSPLSNAVTFAPADTTAPSAPTNLTATRVGTTGAHLAWGASTDNIGVTGYTLTRTGGAGSVSVIVGVATTYDDAGLDPAATYTYRVTSRDAAGNISPQSNAATLAGSTPVLFADGFESGTLGQWSAPVGLTVQSSTVYAGTRAVRATSTGSAAAWAYHSFATTQTSLYYRLRFDVVSPLPPSATTYLGKFRTSSGTSILGLYVSTTGKLSYRNDAGNTSVLSTAAITTGWHTAEVHLVIAGTSSTVEVWLDGGPVAALTKTENLGTTPIGRVQLGDNTVHTYDVYFDDVAADTAYIT